MIWIAVALAAGLGTAALLRWGSRWGSTPAERALELPGDEYFDGKQRAQVSMTRAISLAAPPERVWPWISQLGRGAGWYSIDWLDNGRRASAWHVVSWVPEPREGDASAIGYLRDIDRQRSLAWWLDGGAFLGSRARLATSYVIRAEGQGTRLISRISADALGPAAELSILAFRVIDSVMACRQLIGLRRRIEHSERDGGRATDPETGDRDQYQLYEVLYAGGDGAGVRGKESGAKWRQRALRDGVFEEA